MSGKHWRAWGVLFRSQNRLDGSSAFLVGTTLHPCRTMLFTTRREARAFIAAEYGYIRERKDLRDEPHGWRMPVPVQVDVRISKRGALP
ncbi:hypothetical protein HNR00_003537 [Methylorubrum rhodinum]|uniref:Uncharacterized protein n=1 Tax=Methylorubrum rhodinum TaxID=29428 RepID=A0A840ZNB5_9HYPH|nr:hypothetical protein [Methylorubrum rhodinum]MBB5758810.1 hypothetical protein [Methylorubrum rhodinum]